MPIMRRRPVLRAAAIGGGAYMAGKKRQESRQREYEQEDRTTQLEDEQTAPAAPEAGSTAGGLSDASIARLEQLGKLHEQGVLTDDEFAQQKAALLEN